MIYSIFFSCVVLMEYNITSNLKNTLKTVKKLLNFLLLPNFYSTSFNK